MQGEFLILLMGGRLGSFSWLAPTSHHLGIYGRRSPHLGEVDSTIRENSDRVVSLLWAAGMAFGLLMTDLTPGYQVDLGSYLFGNILAIPKSDLFWMVGIDCFILLLVLGGYKTLLAVSYDHEYGLHHSG